MTPSPTVDAVFQRKKFLLRQKHFAINEKYYVGDEQANPILFVERPAHFLQSLLAIGAALAALGIVVVVCGLLGDLVAGDEGMKNAIPVGFILGLAAAAVAGGSLAPKRHVFFYRDDSRRELLMKVEQEQRMMILTARFTIKDPAGAVLATLRKNFLASAIMKRWHCHAPDGRRICRVREDSLILALVRRFVASIKTDFVFFLGDTEQIVGRFVRKWTLLDRYVLDITEDTQGALDPRIALAIGVMLDTGERR